MSQPFHPSRSLTTLEQDSTIVAVIEMSQSSGSLLRLFPALSASPLSGDGACSE